MVTYTNIDEGIILNVPKNEFEKFNEKFIEILQDFAREPIFEVFTGSRFHGFERGYRERTNYELGIIAAVVALCCSALVWMVLVAWTQAPIFMTWLAWGIVLGPPLFFFFTTPFIIKYEWVGWLDVVLGDCWYIKIKYPDSLLLERIKNELLEKEKQ